MGAHASCAGLLGITPDVACYGKLLTGGTVPMGVTLATDEVFETFLDDKKENALLHGHSFTAYPIGCAAANAAQAQYRAHFGGRKGGRGNVEGEGEGRGGGRGRGSVGVGVDAGEDMGLGGYWDEGLVAEVSCMPHVRSAVAIGTVLAIEIAGGGGYTSNAAAGVIARLGRRGIYCRPLGNVLYVMCSPFTTKQTCYRLLCDVKASLQEEAL